MRRGGDEPARYTGVMPSGVKSRRRSRKNDGAKDAPQPKPLTYADAGVDIEAGDRVVDLIERAVRRTHGPRVLGPLGGFAGMFRLDYNEQLPQNVAPRRTSLTRDLRSREHGTAAMAAQHSNLQRSQIVGAPLDAARD